MADKKEPIELELDVADMTFMSDIQLGINYFEKMMGKYLGYVGVGKYKKLEEGKSYKFDAVWTENKFICTEYEQPKPNRAERRKKISK